jgi:hypothetical protein
MGEILKALLASRIGQIFLAAILIIAAGSIVSVLVLLWRVVGRGSTLDLWGLTISSTTTPTSQEAKTASSPGKTIPSEKIVYVKLLHMRERNASQQPVYRYQFWDGQECDVWDEAVYMFYQSFPEEQQSFRWNIRSSGIAHPNLLQPLDGQDRISRSRRTSLRSLSSSHLLCPFPRIYSGFPSF